MLAAVLESRGMVLVMVWLAGFGLAAWGARRLFARFVVAPARLLEHAQAMLAGAAVHELAAEGSAANRELTATLNALLRQRAQLRRTSRSRSPRPAAASSRSAAAWRR